MMAKLFLIFLLQIIYGFHFPVSESIEKLDYDGLHAGKNLLRTYLKKHQSLEGNNIENVEAISKENSTENELFYRLPNTTYPLHYYLHITTNIHRGILDFKGNCTIEIFVLNSTNELVLHASNLNILRILIYDRTAKKSIGNLSYRIMRDMLIIFRKENDVDTNMKSFRRNRRLRLEIIYLGLMSTENFGFYRMSYTTNEGEVRFGGATFFEPTYARNALPCYDEPRFKSKFTIEITHGNNLTAISNMPNNGDPISNQRNMTTTRFLESPVMSTYILAFAVFNLKNTSMHKENIFQRLFILPHMENDFNMNFLNESFHAIKAFERIFDVQYSLPKLDHYFVNEQQVLGMENWGLLSYTANKSPEVDLIITLCHEIVHQWFGNFITPEFWTYLWLKEGYAQYYSYVLSDILTPQKELLKKHQISCIYKEFSGRDKTALIKYPDKPSDIFKLYNIYHYFKGGCVVQMFEHAFGQNAFRKASSKFLKAHAYSTVTDTDLYDAMQQELVQHFGNWTYKIKNIMHMWTHSPNYPKIKIIRNYDNQTSIIKIQQISFTANDEYDLFWIPLNFITPTNNNFENTSIDFFMPPVHEYRIDLEALGIKLEANDWLLANKRGIGFYSVRYDKKNMDLINKVLRTDHKTIHFQNRASYLYDIAISPIDIISALESLAYLKNNYDYLVWDSAFSLMNKLRIQVQGSELAEKLLKEYIFPILETFKKHLHVTKDENWKESLCNSNYETCKLNYIYNLFRKEIYAGPNEELYQGLLFNMTGDKEQCENNTISYISYLINKRASHRASAWKTFKEYLPRLLVAPCADVFFVNLNKNLVNIPKSHTEEVRYIYELYFKHKGVNGIFNEGIIGLNVRNISESVDRAINWLKMELKGRNDTYLDSTSRK